MFILETVRKLASTDRIAAIGDGPDLTYHDLDANSESLAAFLLDKYPGKSPIILWGDKEHDMLVGVLAALKTGRPYVMVPNYYPEKRVQQIVEGCEPCAVFFSCDEPFPCARCDAYDKQALQKVYADYSGNHVDPSFCVQRDDMVCLFYTSGSTGTPKGVIITRRNIEAFVDWWYPLSNLGIEEPRMLNFTPYGFSSSIATIYNGLGKLGCTLYAVNKKLSANYPALLEYIFRVDPHYFDCTPSFADICLQDERFDSQGLPSMRQLSVGGEPCPHRIALKLLDAFPDSQIINGYGATETTIGTVACDITREMATSDLPLPIGYASPNSRCMIWDENGNELPDGETGELIIVSDMISAGYYKDPERTAQAYFVAEDGTRGYHTHDLAWKKDGLIYYVGRADNMVKVGGYRVEMEEIERRLSQVSIVEQCAVAPAMEDQRTVMLVAYVVLKPDAKKGVAAISAIKKEMAQSVQAYMVPQKIVFLDQLPHNSNDKIDRHLLREMSKITK